MLEKLAERIGQYEKQIEQSAANHNALIGALAELKNIYELAKKDIEEVNPEAIDAVVSEM